MPIYEYCCEACGHEFETMQKITEKPIRKCEACGKMKAKRIISRTSFVLKGSGWYVTDYGGKNASKSVPKKPDSGTEGSSDNKSKAGASDAKTTKKAANA